MTFAFQIRTKTCLFKNPLIDALSGRKKIINKVNCRFQLPGVASLMRRNFARFIRTYCLRVCRKSFDGIMGTGEVIDWLTIFNLLRRPPPAVNTGRPRVSSHTMFFSYIRHYYFTQHTDIQNTKLCICG